MLPTIEWRRSALSHRFLSAFMLHYTILSLPLHTLFITSKGFRASFQKEFIIQKVSLGREPTQASWEKGKNNSTFFKKQIQFLIMLETSFPFYSHTCDRHPPIPTIFWESGQISLFTSFQRKEHIPFVPERGKWPRRGLPEGLSTSRVLHKIGDQEILIGSC